MEKKTAMILLKHDCLPFTDKGTDFKKSID